MSFRNLLAQVADRNMRQLRERAFAANAIAKSLTGVDRQKMYAVKHRSGSRAVELGAARLSEVLLGDATVFCGVSFSPSCGGGRLHLPLDERVTPLAQEILLKQAGKMIGPRTFGSLSRTDRTPSVPPRCSVSDDLRQAQRRAA